VGVFLDETSTQTPLTRTHGRAPRGERVVGAVPRNYGPNVTCLVAMSPAGMQAPYVFDGAVTSDLFVRRLRRWLVPTLRWGTTVIMDTLSVHRNADVQAVLAVAGCHLVYLPAYSPDFNPIEPAFAKLKTTCAPPGRGPSRHWSMRSAPVWTGSAPTTSPAATPTAGSRCLTRIPSNHHENRSRFRRPTGQRTSRRGPESRSTTAGASGHLVGMVCCAIGSSYATIADTDSPPA
jgi:hypothetical protein